MCRYELADLQGECILPFFPDRHHNGGAGQPCNDHRTIVTANHWRLHTGVLWPEIAKRYGSWETVYARFHRWRKDGT